MLKALDHPKEKRKHYNPKHEEPLRFLRIQEMRNQRLTTLPLHKEKKLQSHYGSSALRKKN